MSKVKIYVDGLSQPARALMLYVRAAGVPSEQKFTSIGERKHKTEEYKKINPVQKIPAIDHDGFKLSESVAILRYLSRTFPGGDKFYPSNDSKTVARADEYMEWQHLNLRPFVSQYFASYIMPQMLGLDGPDPKFQQKAKVNMEKTFDLFESVFRQRGKFIAGDNLTIADFIAVGELEQPKLVNYDVRNTRPVIGAYLERVREQTSPSQYDEVHQALHKFQANMKEAGLNV